MIKIISFDLDGTLVKPTYADKVWLEGLPKIYSKEKNIPIKQAKQYIYKLYDEVGEYRIEWYDIDWWFKKFKLKESWQNLLKNYKHNISLYPETIETLEKLSKKYLLIIISNAKREFLEIQLEETNIRSYFKHIFSSLSDFKEVKKTTNVYEKILNTSINQTISRTILTSATTLIVVVILFVFGGEILKPFAFAIMIGILIGTYSSIFVASPLVLEWQLRAEQKKGRKSIMKS